MLEEQVRNIEKWSKIMLIRRGIFYLGIRMNQNHRFFNVFRGIVGQDEEIAVAGERRIKTLHLLWWLHCFNWRTNFIVSINKSISMLERISKYELMGNILILSSNGNIVQRGEEILFLILCLDQCEGGESVWIPAYPCYNRWKFFFSTLLIQC